MFQIPRFQRFGFQHAPRSPLAPLKKGGTGSKVPLVKGDLGGSIPGRFLQKALLMPIVVSIGFWTMPAQAQTDVQISALVEAFRLASPDTGIENDGLYSDWQIKGENIQGWSKFCKQPTTIAEFEANPDLARSIVTCVVADLLQEEYEASGDRLEVAVKRSASWWMTGDSTLYLRDATIAEYTGMVWNFFLAQLQPKG